MEKIEKLKEVNIKINRTIRYLQLKAFTLKSNDNENQ